MTQHSALSTQHLRIGLLASDLTHRHGWGSYSLHLIHALRAQGVRLTILASRNTPQVEGLDVLPILPAIDPRDRALLPRLMVLVPHVRAALRDCSVVHATIEPFAPLATWVGGARPVFVTGHGSYVRLADSRHRLVRPFYVRAFRRAHLVCVSRYTARVAQEATPGVRTSVVNNGVDAARFASLPPLDEPKRGRVILSVGAVKARKGTLELVRAMPAVRRAIPDARCVILGSLTMEADYAARVQAEVKSLGLEDCVQLPGYVPEATLLAWYGAADVFVLPSINAGWKFEGYGLSLIEASAAGLPVIGTTDCGAEDAVDDGETGLLVPQAQLAETLPGAIIRLLSDPDLAARMGAAGRAKAQAQTWARVARQMIALYQQDMS